MNIKNQSIKKILILLTVIMCIITVNKLVDTYALFYSEMIGTASKELARWEINVNQNNINTVQSFNIQNINITPNSHTEAGKIAPGMSGYFDICINPDNTQVSIRYDLTIDQTNLQTNSIEVASVQKTQGVGALIQTGENTYTGTILLADIIENETNTIRISFEWNNDEANNTSDSTIGTVWNNTVGIPISVNVSQYLGEEIVSIN